MDVRLIDANALIRKIEDGVWVQIEDGYGNAIGREKLNPDFAFVINEMPTIDAQPVKRGKWEWEPGCVGTTARCSACGLSPRGFYSLPKNQIGRLPEYRFCPNCGARMSDHFADAGKMVEEVDEDGDQV